MSALANEQAKQTRSFAERRSDIVSERWLLEKAAAKDTESATTSDGTCFCILLSLARSNRSPLGMQKPGAGKRNTVALAVPPFKSLHCKYTK